MRPALTPARVTRAIEAASAVFEVPRREIVSRCKLPAVTRARLALYAALYTACETSYPELARTLNRDHSTLLYGVKRAAAMAETDRDYATAVIQIAKAAQA